MAIKIVINSANIYSNYSEIYDIFEIIMCAIYVYV